MALIMKGTLHRDVSIQNIVFGKPGAEAGNRGVLIDFDMAVHNSADGTNPPADWRIVRSQTASVSFCPAHTPITGDSLVPVGDGALQR